MPTIREVAGRARVSPTTVSHVINATRFVSADIRARVRTAMAELGYHPNAVARSLRRGRTRTLGLVLPDSANPYFAELGRGIEAAAFARGHSVILCNTEGEPRRERVYLDLLAQGQVDGLLVVPAGNHGEILTDLLRRPLPVVLVDRGVPEVAVDAVLTDKRGGAYLATRHLISLGHRRIGCIGGPSRLQVSGQRLQGYCDALVEAGLPQEEALVRRGDYHPRSGWAAARDLLLGPAPPSAIFAANDLMAFGVLRAAGELGRRVPGDLAVVGFDDIELASYTTPPLTTVTQSASDVGRAAVEILLERLADPARAPARRTLPTRLVVRASCGSPLTDDPPGRP